MVINGKKFIMGCVRYTPSRRANARGSVRMRAVDCILVYITYFYIFLFTPNSFRIFFSNLRRKMCSAIGSLVSLAVSAAFAALAALAFLKFKWTTFLRL